MTVVLDGSSLTIEAVVRIARDGEPVALDPAALDRIVACRAMLERKLAAHEVMYGTNTGIGEFSEVVLTDEQVEQFQRYLIYNHAAGIGDPAPVEVVRAAMAGRINVHAHGNSGCRPEITQTLVEMLNRGVTPVVAQKGSVGASGDLAPMAQVALLLMGEGEAWFDGERLPGAEAMARAGIEPPGLRARDGLATINGSNVLTAMSAVAALRHRSLAAPGGDRLRHDPRGPVRQHEALRPRLHELRGFPGAIRSARAIRRVIQGSDLVDGTSRPRCRTPIRCAPRRRSSARPMTRWPMPAGRSRSSSTGWAITRSSDRSR